MLCSSQPAKSGLYAIQCMASAPQAHNSTRCNTTCKAAKCLVCSGRRQEVNSQQTVNNIRTLLRDTRCAPNVTLAKFHQLSSEMQARQTRAHHTRRSQRVQNQSHTLNLSIEGRLSQISILRGSGAHNMLNTHGSQQMPLQAATSCGPHLATKGMNHLARCQTNASSSSVHKDRLLLVTWK